MVTGSTDWPSALAAFENAVHKHDPAAIGSALFQLGSGVAHCPGSEIGELAAVGAMHPYPWVRRAVLDALALRAPGHPEVRELVSWLTHDFEDIVAFAAIDQAGRLRLTDALADLIVIVGRASRRLAGGGGGKPVGLGHAMVLRAVTAIAGSEQPADLARIEESLFPGGTDSGRYPQLPEQNAEHRGTHDHASRPSETMRHVPGGPVVGGPPPAFDPATLLFDWDDPREERRCADFWMDTVPVSVAEYDRFALSPAAREHTYCHPAEPAGKLHLRNTLLDPRSGPDHPVTGVDWFDAYAYARSAGKRLPTETEWQRAGEGAERRAYPWGDDFDGRLATCMPAPSPAAWEGVLGWRRDLLRLFDEPPAATTVARGRPGSESPYGIRDLSGNVWEWTASGFDGPPFSPSALTANVMDTIYDTRSYAVIKGGAWSTPPEQAAVAFRGRDLAYDRHFEIGFRCVCDCPADARGPEVEP